MARRTVYHVVPNKGQGWQVKREGAAKPSARAATQGGAERIARHMAREHQPGQTKIHRPDGRIREEHTYGDDPYPPVG